MKRVSVAMITIFIIYFLCPIDSFADMPWYVIPVEITKTDNTIHLGFLTLYGDEIRGYDSVDEKARHVLAFGMNRPSTKTLKWEGVDYDFDSITVISASVTVSFKKVKYTVQNVDFFFSERGIELCSHVWTNKKGTLEKESRFLLTKEVKSVRRIGDILNIPAYED